MLPESFTGTVAPLSPSNSLLSTLNISHAPVAQLIEQRFPNSSGTNPKPPRKTSRPLVNTGKTSTLVVPPSIVVNRRFPILFPPFIPSYWTRFFEPLPIVPMAYSPRLSPRALTRSPKIVKLPAAMATSKSFVRAEVLDYLKAGKKLLWGVAGSHDEFLIASQILKHKDSLYTERELVLVQEMVRRLSIKCGEDDRPSRPFVKAARPLPALRLV